MSNKDCSTETVIAMSNSVGLISMNDFAILCNALLETEVYLRSTIYFGKGCADWLACLLFVF